MRQALLKSISICAALSVSFSAVPAAFAVNDEKDVDISTGSYDELTIQSEITASGSCGENVTWTLDEDGALTISGEGNMYDYSEYDPPWASYREIITSVVFEDGVTKIGVDAFEGCLYLTEITLPDSVTSIGNRAFENCYGLSSIVLPNSVTSIGDSAFNRCFNLSSIVLPNSVTSIGDNAFYLCKLTDILYMGTEEQWNKISGNINYINANASIHYESIIMDTGNLGDDITCVLDSCGGLHIIGFRCQKVGYEHKIAH